MKTSLITPVILSGVLLLVMSANVLANNCSYSTSGTCAANSSSNNVQSTVIVVPNKPVIRTNKPVMSD